jgi:hypothetical protein
VTVQGKEASRRNAVRHGLTSETVVGALEDAEDYKAFEAGITADYDAQSTVERELVLRLASLLWRLRRATAVETGLLELHAPHNAENEGRSSIETRPLYTLLHDRDVTKQSPVVLARCFVSFLDQANYAFDRLGRYETMLWRQVGQVIFALDGLERCKPQERRKLRRRSATRTSPDIHECDQVR